MVSGTGALEGTTLIFAAEFRSSVRRIVSHEQPCSFGSLEGGIGRNMLLEMGTFEVANEEEDRGNGFTLLHMHEPGLQTAIPSPQPLAVVGNEEGGEF